MVKGVRMPLFSWGCRYAVLALRAEELCRAATGDALVDYKGPVEWIEDLQEEAPPTAAELVSSAEELLAELPGLMLNASLTETLYQTVEAIRSTVSHKPGLVTTPERSLITVDVDALFEAG
ncbi:hypothetical protein [Micromonospora zamorensis]|uniref:hypothetical protein n=1 Tax=Micromonospora zamorensis TaxID=709883 RepID=UPI0033EAD52C